MTEPKDVSEHIEEVKSQATAKLDAGDIQAAVRSMTDGLKARQETANDGRGEYGMRGWLMLGGGAPSQEIRKWIDDYNPEQ